MMFTIINKNIAFDQIFNMIKKYDRIYSKKLHIIKTFNINTLNVNK